MDFERLFDLLPYRAKRFPNSIAAAGRQDGHWQTLSIEDAIQLCDRLSTGMLHQGWKKGDVIILSATTGSPAWQIIDFAAQQAGIIPVPVHPSSPDAERDYILRETQPKACFVANSLLLKSWKGHWPQQQYFTLQPGGEQPYWQDLLTEEIDITALEQARSQVRPEDLATIVYTSGTTGEPKGVMLSHRNIVSNIKSTLPLVPINYRSTTLSFLPLTHIFERMVTWSYWAAGATTYFAQNSDSVLTDMQEVRPHYFTAVPRLLERMYERIHERAGKSGWLVKNIIRWAIKLGEAYEPFKRPLPWYGLQLVLADILVYRRWRRLLGGRVKGVAVGAAALSANLSRLFSAAGVAIREGYGMTEASPVIAFNRFEPGGYRFGTAGMPIPGIEVKIHEPDEQGEGEIFVRGPNIMMGYYQQQEITRQVLQEDGWLHTGDMGRWTHRHFLQITGRRRNAFKTTSGKFVAPERVEAQLQNSPLVEHCLVTGLNRPYPVALIWPHFPTVEQWCAEHRVHWTAPTFMVHNPKVNQLFQEVIQTLNAQLSAHERIRKFHLLALPPTIEAGELTPTLKIKRHPLTERYNKEIDALY